MRVDEFSERSVDPPEAWVKTALLLVSTMWSIAPGSVGVSPDVALLMYTRSSEMASVVNEEAMARVVKDDVYQL